MIQLYTSYLHLYKRINLSFTFIIVLLILVQTIKGVEFNKRSFAIAEFSNGQDMISVLKEGEILESFGMSITIKEDSLDHSLYIVEKNGQLKLSDFLLELKAYLNIHDKRVFPLFINYSGSESVLIEEFKTADILNKLFYQPPGERWPTEEEILLQKKPLIIYNQGKCNATSTYINCKNNHVLEFSLKKQVGNSEHYGVWKGNKKNELLMTRRFTQKELRINKPPKDWGRISLNSYSIDYLVQCWKINGKTPNFIFYSSPNYTRTFHYLTETLKDFTSVEGKIYMDGKIATGVSWLHDKQAFTNGYFSFPYDKGTDFKLTPFKQGYQFSPSQIDVDKAKSQNRPIEFTTSPLRITEGLTAAYYFNHSLANVVSQKGEVKQDNTFINDNERGAVLKVSDGSFASLSKAEDYNIVNNSFTVSIYFKLNEKQEFKEQCIFGSNEEGFCKGLHAVIKYGNIQFGFYTNDCSTSYKIIPLKWYQLTVRYDIVTEIQSIFINGKKIGESYNHPPFIGSTELLLGHGLKQDNFMNGYLDDLHIWSRALSDEEISWLNDHSVEISKGQWLEKNSTTKWIIAIVVLLFLLAYFLYRMKLLKQQTLKAIQPEVVSPDKNAIYLFGKFSLIDQKGQDQSPHFSPKIKELFLLLLFSSLKDTRGISTNELTEALWPDFEPNKAANNRGVTINGLRKALDSNEGIEVVFEDKYWRLLLKEDTYCDVKLVLDFISNKKLDYASLYSIINRGEFLSGVKKEWLLEYKSTLSFDLIDKLLAYLKELTKKKEYNTVYKVVDYVFKMDDLNVQALHYQLKCLTKQGSGNKAVFLFDKYCEKYASVHSKKYDYDIKKFLATDVDYLWEK